MLNWQWADADCNFLKRFFNRITTVTSKIGYAEHFRGDQCIERSCRVLRKSMRIFEKMDGFERRFERMCRI